MKFELIFKKMKLLYGEEQEYVLDTNPKANLAEYRKKEKYVHDKFCISCAFDGRSKYHIHCVIVRNIRRLFRIIK
jgi:hypothetical protein